MSDAINEFHERLINSTLEINKPQVEIIVKCLTAYDTSKERIELFTECINIFVAISFYKDTWLIKIMRYLCKNAESKKIKQLNKIDNILKIVNQLEADNENGLGIVESSMHIDRLIELNNCHELLLLLTQLDSPNLKMIISSIRSGRQEPNRISTVNQCTNILSLLRWLNGKELRLAITSLLDNSRLIVHSRLKATIHNLSLKQLDKSSNLIASLRHLNGEMQSEVIKAIICKTPQKIESLNNNRNFNIALTILANTGLTNFVSKIIHENDMNKVDDICSKCAEMLEQNMSEQEIKNFLTELYSDKSTKEQKNEIIQHSLSRARAKTVTTAVRKVRKYTNQIVALFITLTLTSCILPPASKQEIKKSPNKEEGVIINKNYQYLLKCWDDTAEKPMLDYTVSALSQIYTELGIAEIYVPAAETSNYFVLFELKKITPNKTEVSGYGIDNYGKLVVEKWMSAIKECGK